MTTIADTAADAEPRQQASGRILANSAGWAVAALASVIAVALVLLIVAAASLPFLGFRTIVISGGSMEPAIHRGSLVVSRLVDADTLEVGDVISYRRPEADARVTHRITAIEEANGSRSFTVKGDANASADPTGIEFHANAEKVLLDVPYVGYWTAFAHSAQGILLLLVLPAIGLALLYVLDMGKGMQSKDATPG